MPVVKGGSKCNLITSYKLGEDNDWSFGRHRWLAQVFNLDDLYVVWRCRLKSFTLTGGLFYHYALRNVDGAGKPTGADLAHTTLSPTGESWLSPGKWRRFDFGTFPNLPAGFYALLVSVPDAAQTWNYKLRGNLTAPNYPLGKAWISPDSGNNWSELANTDFMFEIWGWQPPPVADPVPVISNWAPLATANTLIEDGYEIVVTTDIPVHLFMRWTTIEPLKHPLTEYRRGILIQIGTRYCFVAWKENEQVEPGDTLIHTFIKDNWPVCQTRYFYFIGTKQAEEQPSASPIFKLHRDKLPPFICAAGDIARIKKYLQSDLSFIRESNAYGNFYALAESADYIYGGGADFIVRKFLKTDLSLVTSSPSFAEPIRGIVAQDDLYLYVIHGLHKLSKLLKSDLSTVATLDLGGLHGPFYALTEDTGYCYVAGQALNFNLAKILKTTMLEETRSISYGGQIRAATNDDYYAYAGGEAPQKIWKFLKSDMSKTAESPDYGGTISALDNDDEHVYAGGSTGLIRKYLKSDMSYIMQSPNYGGGISALVVEGDYVYAGGGTTQKIRKYLKSDLSYITESPDYGGTIRALSVY